MTPTALVPVALVLFNNKNFWLSGITDVDARPVPESVQFVFPGLGALYDFLRSVGYQWIIKTPEYLVNGVVRAWLFVDPNGGDEYIHPAAHDLTDHYGHTPFRAGAVYLVDTANYTNAPAPTPEPSPPFRGRRPLMVYGWDDLR